MPRRPERDASPDNTESSVPCSAGPSGVTPGDSAEGSTSVVSREGRRVAGGMDRWLIELREAEKRFEAQLVADQRSAREHGQCDVIVRIRSNAKSRRGSPADDPKATKRVCKKPCSGLGKCHNHLLSILYVSSGQAGGGDTRRPFAGWQVPLSRMSEVQLALLANARSLPLSTPYDECIARLVATDPSSPLSPIHEKPTGGRLKSRRPKKAD